MVLDMERNDALDTYGITDGSAGLRGDVIRTANGDVIKLYAASSHQRNRWSIFKW